MESNHRHYFTDEGFGAMCRDCGMTPDDVAAARKPLLLIGGPWDLDGTEIPDKEGATVRIVKDTEGQDNTYYVIHDWSLMRWVGKWQNTRKVA